MQHEINGWTGAASAVVYVLYQIVVVKKELKKQSFSFTSLSTFQPSAMAMVMSIG